MQPMRWQLPLPLSLLLVAGALSAQSDWVEVAMQAEAR